MGSFGARAARAGGMLHEPAGRDGGPPAGRREVVGWAASSPRSRRHGTHRLPALRPAALRRPGRSHAAAVRALRALRHLRRGGDRGRFRRGSRPAPRRGAELRAHRRPLRPQGARSRSSPPAPTTSARPTPTTEPLVPGIEPFLHHEGFIEAARRVYGRAMVRPNIVYANLLVPGQELAVHTDVPEFRGVNRKRDPQWLIVAMHHSRLFERWRMPIATGVAWFGNPEGGEFVFYPEGPWGAPVALTRAPQHRDPARHGHGLPRRRPGRGVARPDAGSEARDAAVLRGRRPLEPRAAATRCSRATPSATCASRSPGRPTATRTQPRSGSCASTATISRARRSSRCWSRICAAAVASQDAVPNDTDLALAIISEYIQYPPPAPAHRRPAPARPARTADGIARRAHRETSELPPRRRRAPDARRPARRARPGRERPLPRRGRDPDHARARDPPAAPARRRPARLPRARRGWTAPALSGALHAAALRRDARARARAADSRRAGHAAPRLLGPPAPRPLRSLRRALRLAPLRLHPARGDRRAQVLPLLRRAGDEGALPDRRHDGAREPRALERADRAHAAPPGRPPAGRASTRRLPSRPTWWRSPSVRSRPRRRCSVGRTPIRVWHAPGKRRLTAFALEAARASLARLERYFDLPYPYAKLDLVAVPDFEFGAMENAGAVFFRETLLLLDPATATLAERKRAAEVIAHELAHMWYGDLVTMAWWDDLWLNEAFATWMAFSVVDDWKPAWRMWHDFQHGRSAALELDALRHTHPIYCEVRTAEEANANFDLITYEKGASVVRMLERYLGPAPSGAACAPTSAAIARATRARPTSGARSPRPRASPSKPWPARGSSRRAIRCCSLSQHARARALAAHAHPVALRACAARRSRARGRALADPLGGARSGDAARARASQRKLLVAARERVDLGRSQPAFVYGNADEGGFFRPSHDAAGAARARRLAARALAPSSGWGSSTTSGRSCARDARASTAFSSSAEALADERDPDVLLALRRPLGFIGGSLVPDAAPDSALALRALRGAQLRPGLRALGWEPRRGGNGDDARAPRGAARPGGRRRRRERGGCRGGGALRALPRRSPLARPEPRRRRDVARGPRRRCAPPSPLPRRHAPRRDAAGAAPVPVRARPISASPSSIERTLALSLTGRRRHPGRDLPARAPAREPGGARIAPGAS